MTQRSPILLWLLAGATLSVYAVAIDSLFTFSAGGRSLLHFSAVDFYRALLLYEALATALVSIVCIGTVFWRAARIVQGLAIAGTIIVAAVPVAWLNVLNFAQAAGYFGGQAILLVLSLWILRQSRYWRRRNRQEQSERLTFSIFDVLALTTATALVMGLLKYQNSFDVEWIVLYIPAIVGNAALGVAAVAMHAMRQPIWIRSAALLATAVGAGYAISFLGWYAGEEIAGFLIQAVVLLAWLEIGHISLPWRNDALDTSTATSQPGHKA